MRWLLLALVFSLLVAGCRSAAPPASAPETVWVAQSFSGGVQCGPASDYEPPDTHSLFEQAEIPVHDVAVEALAIPAVCGASAYAAIHYALIDRADLEDARRLGFDPSDEPPDWARRTPATDPRG